MNETMQHFVSADLTDWLPEPAADRLRKLRQRVTDARALLPDRETIDQARLDKLQIADRLSRLRRSHAEDGFGIEGDDHPAVRDALAKLKKTEAELARLLETDNARAATWQQRGQLLQRCEDWLRSGVPSGTTLAPIEVEAPLKKGETITAAIDRLRHRHRELAADLHRTQSAPFPSSEAKLKAREWVERLAAQAAPDVSRLVEIMADVQLPTEQLTVQIFNSTPGAIGFLHQPNPVAVQGSNDRAARCRDRQRGR